MTAHTVQLLDRFGPDECSSMTVDEAQAWCRTLARTHAENFSVLTALVPRDRRVDFAAVYAFCRWADDLGDEIGDRDRSLELLAWWRRELGQCFEGEPRHPVFVALEPVIRRHDLPMKPFDDLIRAFEQDQRVTRFETWTQLIDYCRLSADPVGRLVLMVLGEPRDEALFALSDATCTALQLTNHWQDARRDLLERDRIYIPSELITIERFEERFRASAEQGWAIDKTFLPEARALIRTVVDRTWPMYQRGQQLLDAIEPSSRGVVGLLAAGGIHVLRLIEMWNYETVLHRPALSRVTKGSLVARAWLETRFGGRRKRGVGSARGDQA